MRTPNPRSDASASATSPRPSAQPDGAVKHRRPPARPPDPTRDPPPTTEAVLDGDGRRSYPARVFTSPMEHAGAPQKGPTKPKPRSERSEAGHKKPRLSGEFR